MNFIFATWKKLKNHQPGKSSKKIFWLASLKSLKNMDLFFCKLQKPRKDEFSF